ncbi:MULTISPECIES: hypothetical protein [Eikenella]|uniref:Uncharacterized protein n=1 Tax=Eikenella longinqua TaxID=1795827 RepID=A0A1A9RWJ0_9NEIS|nr:MULTISPECIES: hypothetical protein [Eikenella]OAM26823.1 hypothetical protein A7P95_08700 [Eikenella longinqua]
MKKTAAWILFSVVATLNAQQALAGNQDDAQKISVVKGFLDCNAKGVCVQERTAENATKRFLSRSAIAVLAQEKRRFQADEDCSAVIPRCYSGLWSEPGNGGFAWNAPKFSVHGNTVSADFGKTDGVARFKLVRENGQYKIDNSIHVSPDFQAKWWR